MEITKTDAVRSLCPRAKYIAHNEIIVEWHSPDIPQPSDAEIEAEVARLIAEQPAKEARAKRDRLLTKSDWVTIRATDTGDPVPTEWQTYRQALRDITEQTGFPREVTWPTEPTNSSV
jgi:hypothetical protein